MCEIAPNFIHPEINKKICDICEAKLEKNIIRKVPQNILILNQGGRYSKNISNINPFNSGFPGNPVCKIIDEVFLIIFKTNH